MVTERKVYYKVKVYSHSELTDKITENMGQVLDDWKQAEKMLVVSQFWYIAADRELPPEAEVAAEMNLLREDPTLIRLELAEVTQEEYEQAGKEGEANVTG